MTDLKDEIASELLDICAAYSEGRVDKMSGCAQAIIDLIIARIPPLMWMGGGGRHHAGNYVIEDVSVGQREIRRLLCASFGTTYISDFAGDRPLEAAKAAANAHHVAQLCKGMGIE